MKKIFFLIFLLLLGAGGWLFFRTNFLQQGSCQISVLVDKTDSLLAPPHSQELISMLKLEIYKWQSVEARLQIITNIDYNMVYTTTLPGRHVLLFNPSTRDAEIDSFTRTLQTNIEAINHLETGRATSSIYGTVMREINRVAATGAETKVVVIYSDLQQNIPDQFSMYNEADRALLNKHPEIVQKCLEEILRPADLHGVSVYLIYKAKNDMDNKRFLSMSGLLKKMIVGAGGQVYIGANIVVEK